MHSRLQCLFIGLTILANYVPTTRAAVAFNVTPSAVSNTYSGSIILQITGLTNTETVVIQKFLDLNTNGVIDGGDLLVQQFNLTDGRAGMVIGGVTNLNVPGDLNAASGAITAALNFQNGDFVQRIAGNFFYKLASPASRFTPLTNRFAVTNLPFPQRVTGNVISNATGVTVPRALIVLLQPPREGQNGPGTPLAGVVADNSGGYSVPMPPGTYVPLVLSSNYVFDFFGRPTLVLGASQTLTTNLTLMPASASISGKVADAGDTSIGLPGVWIFSLTQNGLLATAFADANGNFNLRVTSGQWALDTLYPVVGLHGYVGWYDSPFYVANAGTTGLMLAYPKASALFYGSVKDNLGNPVSGVAIESTDNNRLYYTESYTDANGNYVVTALGGVNNPWSVRVENDSRPTNYVFSYPIPDATAINAGQSLRQDFTALPAGNIVSGFLRDDFGHPIPGVGIWANGTIGGIFYHVYSVKTDAAGHYVLNMANGDWYVGGFVDLTDNYLSPGDEFVTIFNNDAEVDFVAPLVSPITMEIEWLDPVPQLSVFGEVGTQFVLEYVSDLTDGSNWLPLTTDTIISSPFVFTDTSAAGSATRFYRARVAP